MKRFVPLLLILSLSVLYGCDSVKLFQSKTTLQREDWAPDVKEGINDFLELYGGCKNAYAVFDFDNSCSIFDIEEQLLAYQLETMSFALDPEGLAYSLAEGLENVECLDWIDDISAAYSYLYQTYGPFKPEGLDEDGAAKVCSDPMWLEFASKMGCMYEKVAEWASADFSYAWVLQWFAGMTEQQVYSLALRSHEKYSKVETSVQSWKGPEGSETKVGPVEYSWTSGIQVTENIRELWKALDDRGIDVWVCSASGIQQVLAAIDAFGLHDSCTGVLAMTMKLDEKGIYLPEFDYENGHGYVTKKSKSPAGKMTKGPEGWYRDGRLLLCQTSGPGKVTAIKNVIAPRYEGEGPIAGFMDSTGDFNFCTEFNSLKMVVCFNRANRKITDGGGLIAEIAMYEKDELGYNVASANEAGDTMYLLQGRDENGLRTFIGSNGTIRYGHSEEQLFANEDNHAQLAAMRESKMSVEEAVNTFSRYFLKGYSGYHTK